MPALPLAYQNIAADLVARVQADAGTLRGTVYRQTKRDVVNIYAKVPVGAGRRSVFLGAEGKPQTDDKVRQLKDAGKRARQRRRDFAVLETMGLLSSDAFGGRVVDALSHFGLFQRGGVLVGTLAYQCYGLLLGWQLPSTMLSTDDADLAAANVALKAAGEIDMVSILKYADATFAPVPGLDPKSPPWRFRAANGYLVDLLTPVRQRNDKQPIPLEGLAAGAMGLQYLAWLIDGALPAALPFGPGVAVTIPQPERFAVHKMILSQVRDSDRIKSQKDLAQAGALIEAIEAVRPGRIGDTVAEACDRGTKGWQTPLTRAAQALFPYGGWRDMDIFESLL